MHTARLMPLPLTVSCFNKIQIALTFWYRLTRVVLDKGPLNVCVCVLVLKVAVWSRSWSWSGKSGRVCIAGQLQEDGGVTGRQLDGEQRRRGRMRPAGTRRRSGGHDGGARRRGTADRGGRGGVELVGSGRRVVAVLVVAVVSTRSARGHLLHLLPDLTQRWQRRGRQRRRRPSTHTPV